MDISTQLFLKRGGEYTLLTRDEVDMDDVVLFKHTPCNSRRTHIFFASPRQLIETSLICPTCSGELELVTTLITMVNEIFNNPKLLDNSITFALNNKKICIDYLGLTYMRNHKLTSDAIDYIEARRLKFDKYLYFTYHDLRSDINKCKESLIKLLEDINDEITSTHDNRK